MLTIDFYESGVGETCVITFPGGGIGIVDAHPSQTGQRPDICSIVGSSHVHFVCLSHPHKDHGTDLVTLMKSSVQIDTFYHGLSNVASYAYEVGQAPHFRSVVQDFASEFRKQDSDFVNHLFGEAIKRRNKNQMEIKQLRSELRSKTVDDVEIYVLGPSERELHDFQAAITEKIAGNRQTTINANHISAILFLKYGGSGVILPGDALISRWKYIDKLAKQLELPKANVVKVPHHGALNAVSCPKKKQGKSNFLDLCTKKPIAVLSAGKSTHPDHSVFSFLYSKTSLLCTSNGICHTRKLGNALNLMLPGARSVEPSAVCNPLVRVALDKCGNACVTVGKCQRQTTVTD